MDQVSLKKAKMLATKLCKCLGIQSLVKQFQDKKKSSLDIFFSAKTCKVGCPLRVIISEKDTWQRCLALFLQDKPSLLQKEDPFLVKISAHVEYLQQHKNAKVSAFSIDIKDLFYSLPQDALLQCVEQAIDRLGAVTFQNSSGVSVGGFLEMLGMYLRSTFATWDTGVYLQKRGICIGSCIAPVLSDLFLAMHDPEIINCQKTECFQVFRFVDDFLIIIDNVNADFHQTA